MVSDVFKVGIQGASPKSGQIEQFSKRNFINEKIEYYNKFFYIFT